jgi:peptide/nickel transport system substrate-binding protein
VLRDRRVRQALAHAIDRQAIVKHLRRGLAEPAVGILPPASHAVEPDVPTFAYDPDRAARLLDEAGYRDPDGDGPRPRLRLSLKVSSVEFNRLQPAAIQQDLARVGIELDVRTYEFATLYADVLRGSFQLFTLQWVGVSDPDMLRRVFHSSQMPPAGFNRGFYSNPDVDRLIDRATVSMDPDERLRLYSEVQRRVAEDVPYVSLWYKTNVAVGKRGPVGRAAAAIRRLLVPEERQSSRAADGSLRFGLRGISSRWVWRRGDRARAALRSRTASRGTDRRCA